MDMKRIEAPTLEEAYKNAAEALKCSVTEIKYEIIQYPSTGLMGLFKKPAIIVAVKKVVVTDTQQEMEKPLVSVQEEEPVETPVTEPALQPKEEGSTKPKNRVSREILDKELITKKKDKVLDSFFDSNEVPSDRDKAAPTIVSDFKDDRDTPENRALSQEIESKLVKLMEISCFQIDTVEVDVFNGTAHIFIDGEDAALLIGKEGYRYNALSYMLFNWINAHYNLYINLEIAEFIQDQEEMIANYLVPIIEHINEKGRGKTKPLDGILVQIALEQLRATFPNKYVAIKTGRDGKKFIIVNNFNSKKNV